MIEMKPSIRLRNRLRSISEFISSFTQLAYSTVPALSTWAASTLEVYGGFIFYPGWVLDAAGYAFKSLGIFWSPNKNIHKIAVLAFDWLNFGITTTLTFAAAFLSLTSSFALVITMLALGPVINFARAAWYTVKVLLSDDKETREAHIAKIKKNVLNGLITLMIGIAFGVLILVPQLPAAAVITLAIILSCILIPIAFISVTAKCYELGKWVVHKIQKWQKENKEDYVPEIKPELMPQDEDQLIDRHFDDSSLYEDLHQQIENHIQLLQDQRNQSLGFFQDSKRLNKINALRMLQQALNQWDALYKNGIHTNTEKTASIYLDNYFIGNIKNFHTDPDVTRNREKIIKRISQHVFHTYPDAFQSFFNDKGKVELLFNQAFKYMRSMKTADEITAKKEELRNEIISYNDHYMKMRKAFYSTAARLERFNRILYLSNMLNDNPADSLADKDNADLMFLDKGKSKEIYQNISSLKKSEDVLFNLTNIIRPEQDSLEEAQPWAARFI